MATARSPRLSRRSPRLGRAGRAGRTPPAARGTGRLEARRSGPIIDTSKLSHVARRRIASPPMAAVDRVGEAVHAAVLAWAEAFIARVMARIVPSIVKQDATEDDIDAILASLDDPDVSRALLESAFKSVDRASSDDLRVIGVQTETVVRNAERLQAEWLRESTDLIRATEDVRRRVERILKDPVSEGRSVADISKLLQEQAGYAASRAELTARTVTLQTYGKIQEQRQRDAGFTKYVWTTSLDERVREDHAELDGTVQSWDDPPVVDKRTGRRGHPGSDFQCRCSAVPYADPDEVIEPLELELPVRAPAPAPPAVVEAQAAPVRPVEAAPFPARADFSAAEMRASAQDIDVAKGSKKRAAEQIEQAIESGVQGKSLRQLGALDDPNSLRPGSFDFLRTDPTFAQTGNLLDNFASGPGGLPSFVIEPSGKVLLQNGRHRLTIARELGLRQIMARMIRYNARGDEVWSYIGYVRV